MKRKVKQKRAEPHEKRKRNKVAVMVWFIYVPICGNRGEEKGAIQAVWEKDELWAEKRFGMTDIYLILIDLHAVR